MTTPTLPPDLSPAQWKNYAGSFQGAIVSWYAAHKRLLKFREGSDPYAILVSEIMLQQTQVATMLPYFDRFMDAFPTVETLAVAPEEEVMELWAGLGYYRRARLLQAAAKAVVEEFGGVFPRDRSMLESLPGVGRYTAAAIASSAFGAPEAILEANTQRLYARLFRMEEPVQSSAGSRLLWQIAERLTPSKDVKSFNHGVMELGALICKPVPQCERCPVRNLCAAFAAGEACKYPIKPEPRVWLDAQTVCVVARARSDGRYLLRLVPQGQWHYGLWEFPTARLLPGDKVAGIIKELVPRDAVVVDTNYCTYRYTITRHRVQMTVALAEMPQSADDSESERWLTLKQALRLPVASVQKKLLQLLTEASEPGSYIVHDAE